MQPLVVESMQICLTYPSQAPDDDPKYTWSGMADGILDGVAVPCTAPSTVQDKVVDPSHVIL